MSVLMLVLSYGARNVASYTRRILQTLLAFQDSPIDPSRRSPLVASSHEQANTSGLRTTLICAAICGQPAVPLWFDPGDPGLVELSGYLRASQINVVVAMVQHSRGISGLGCC